MKGAISCLILGIIIMSCAPSPKFISPDYSKPEIIVLLPTINQTTDVSGGFVFRNLLYVQLDRKNYTNVIENSVVDALLNEEGITEGGQLSTISNEELFKTLKVEGLMYIELLECEYQTLGISETRKVTANMKLYVPPSILVWEDERTIGEEKSPVASIFEVINDPVGMLKKSGKEMEKQVKEKAKKMWLLDHELQPEMDDLIKTSLKTLP